MTWMISLPAFLAMMLALCFNFLQKLFIDVVGVAGSFVPDRYPGIPEQRVFHTNMQCYACGDPTARQRSETCYTAHSAVPRLHYYGPTHSKFLQQPPFEARGLVMEFQDCRACHEIGGNATRQKGNMRLRCVPKLELGS